MQNAYAQLQDLRAIQLAPDGKITKSWTMSLIRLDGVGVGSTDVSATLVFDAPQHKWTQAATDAAVQAAAEFQDGSPGPGGYRLVFIYLLDTLSIKP